jgi:hypothetical protein
VIVRCWIAIIAGWGIALWGLVGIVKLPGPYLGLYFSDRHIPISRLRLIAGAVSAFVLPLAVATMRRGQVGKSTPCGRRWG